ncbi:Uncharacterized protein DAT39_004230 [Clarias magur]|uniref:Uncharacterized protein n=1 Tax=Clarias magur TaxID=1594786 RepID=A0A8J4U6R0_CLAMG|nr:Uncharacterized protein DAT39_004230 [Clarias magur]
MAQSELRSQLLHSVYRSQSTKQCRLESKCVTCFIGNSRFVTQPTRLLLAGDNGHLAVNLSQGAIAP